MIVYRRCSLPLNYRQRARAVPEINHSETLRATSVALIFDVIVIHYCLRVNRQHPGQLLVGSRHFGASAFGQKQTLVGSEFRPPRRLHLVEFRLASPEERIQYQSFILTPEKSPARGLATSRSVPTVFAINRARAELAAREHRLARMIGRHVSEVALVVRDAEYLEINSFRGMQRRHDKCLPRLAARARIRRPTRPRWHAEIGGRFHAGSPCAPASGGISMALGCACRSACLQILIANTHMARTSNTNTPHTTASR